MRKFFLLALLATQSLLAAPYFDDSSCCGNGIELGADWLYWEAEQSQMEIASHVTANPGVISAQTVTPEFKYSSGVRVYANYELDNCWSLGASVVYIPTSTNRSLRNTGDLATDFIVMNQDLFPIFTVLTSNGINFTNMDIDWKSDMSYLDIPLTYTFSCPCNVSIEPYIGLRGFWNSQKFNINGNAPTTGSTVSSAMSTKMYGVGLLGGVQASWEFYEGLMLVGKFGTSLTYNRIDVDTSMDATATGLGSLRIWAGSRYNRSITSLEAFIGLAYRFDLCGMCGQLRLGWENNLFFNLNQFSITTAGNQNLQGFTLGGSVYF